MLCRIHTAGDEYRSIDALKGDMIAMWCNATKPTVAVTWTRHTASSDVSYLYINGTFTSTHSRYSIQQHGNEHSLMIYNAQVRDTGRYDCYQTDQLRRFGYELNITGKEQTAAEVNLQPN